MKIRGYDGSLLPPDGRRRRLGRHGAGRKINIDKSEISRRVNDIVSRLTDSDINYTSSISKNRMDALPPAPRINRLKLVSRSDKLAAVKRKIASGYYNTPEHMAKLADILIEKLDLDKPES